MRRYLEALIRSELPSHRDVRVGNVTEIEGSWERSLFAFDLWHDDASDPEPLVARFYQGPGGPARAAWEADVLEAVARAGMPVPRVDFASGDASQYGTAVVVMQRIPGIPLDETLAGSPARAEDMADALAALHRVPVDAVFDEHLSPFDEPEFIAPDLDTVTSAVDRYGLGEFAPLIEHLQASVPPTQPRCVLHNDYTPENILVSDGGDLAILDWSFAGAGDHRLDVAWSALWAGARGGNGARAEFLRAYEAAGDKSIERLEYFEALRMGARLMTIAAWLDDALDFPAIKVNKDVIFGGYRATVLTVYERFRDVTGLGLQRFEDL